jgi:cell wall assembly regulator SMI1
LWERLTDLAAAAEQIMGVRLPESYRETLLVDDPSGVPEEFEDSRFRWMVWHPRRIPIAGDHFWDYDNTYLDLIPGSTGTAAPMTAIRLTGSPSSIRTAGCNELSALDSAG